MKRRFWATDKRGAYKRHTTSYFKFIIYSWIHSLSPSSSPKSSSYVIQMTGPGSRSSRRWPPSENWIRVYDISNLLAKINKNVFSTSLNEYLGKRRVPLLTFKVLSQLEDLTLTRGMWMWGFSSFLLGNNAKSSTKMWANAGDVL